MAKQSMKVTRGAMDDHTDELIRAARKLNKLRKNLDKKADAYLAGTYDPGKDLRKTAFKGVTTAAVLLSLLTGIAFSSPADINEEQEAASYRPAPIVMDVSEFVNAPVDDDDDAEADEDKSTRLGIAARFRQAVLSMPHSVRLVVITPLWLIGTALMTLVSFLWNMLFASPVGAFIASFALGFALLAGLFTATAKILFPDIPVKKLLCRRNVILLGCLALVLSCIDAAAPAYWHAYPLAAALLKLILGGGVIGLLAARTSKAVNFLSERLS